MTLFVYQSILDADFISFDDSAYVYDNPDIKKGFTKEGIFNSFVLRKDSGPYWHPVTNISHMADCWLYGLNPGKHHLTNLIIHILNSILVYLFFSRTTGEKWKSFFVAAIFSLHPINVETVAWISQRKNLLVTFFWFLNLNVFALFISKKKIVFLFLFIMIFILGYMSKPVMMTFPFAVLLINYWPFNRYYSIGTSLSFKEKKQLLIKNSLIIAEVVPLIIIMLAVFSAWFFLYSKTSNMISFETVPLLNRIANALVSDIVYIIKMIFPFNFSVYYPYQQDIPIWKSAGALTVLSFFSLYFLSVIKRMPWLAVGWFWYLGNLVIVSGLLQRGYWPAYADRFAYLPLIGIYLIIVWSFPLIIDKFLLMSKQKIALFFGFIVLVGLSFQTIKQVSYWENGITLFSHAVKLNPSDALSFTNLAFSLSEKGRIDEAIKNYYKALEINSGHVEAHNNLAVLLASKGRLRESLKHFQNALILYPDFTDAYVNKALALYKLDEKRESENCFNKALLLEPDNAGAHFGLGTLFLDKGDADKAIVRFAKGLKANSGNDEIYIKYGTALLISGRIYEAVSYFQNFTEKTEDNKKTLNKIAGLFKEYGYAYEADKFYQMVEKIK